MKTITKLWLFIAVLIIISPLGLIIPAYFKAGGAWGEWAPEEIKGLIGYIPRGLERLSAAWNAPLPDYAVSRLANGSLRGLSIGYIISAIAGILVTAGLVYFIGKLFARKG